MSFVRARRTRLGDSTDLPGMSTNPDGTLTYDSQPYDPFDPSNPYNYQPVSIPLQSTPFGTDTTIQTLAPPPSGILSTGLPAAQPPQTPGWVNAVTSIFGSLRPSLPTYPATPYGTPSPYGTTPTYRPAGMIAPTTGGISTSTLLLLGLAGIAAVVLSRRQS